MPKRCCIPTCTSNVVKYPDVSYYEIPSNVHIRDEWLRVISREGHITGSQREPTSRSLVCSLHFDEADYRIGVKRKTLVPSAVPTKFLLSSDNMEPTSSKKPKLVQESARSFHSVHLTLQGNNNIPDEGPAVGPLRHRSADDDARQIPTAQAPHEMDSVCSVDCSVPERSFEDDECQTTYTSTQTAQCDFSAGDGNAPSPTAQGSGEMNAGCSVDRSVEDWCRRYAVFRDKGCQTTFKHARIVADVKTLNERVRRLEETCGNLRRWLAVYERDMFVQCAKQVSRAADCGDQSAVFLRDQVLNFDKLRPTWDENVLKECALWREHSCRGYEHVRSRKVIKLPSRNTLETFMIVSTARRNLQGVTIQQPSEGDVKSTFKQEHNLPAEESASFEAELIIP